MVEKYIDKSSIISVEIHEKTFVNEFYRVYVKPWKFIGLISMTKEKYVYQSCSRYNTSYPKYDTIEEAFNKNYGGYKNSHVLEGNRVYRKPFVKLVDKKGNHYYTYCETEFECQEYLKSLDLDIVNNSIKIKLN